MGFSNFRVYKRIPIFKSIGTGLKSQVFRIDALEWQVQSPPRIHSRSKANLSNLGGTSE